MEQLEANDKVRKSTGKTAQDILDELAAAEAERATASVKAEEERAKAVEKAEDKMADLRKKAINDARGAEVAAFKARMDEIEAYKLARQKRLEETADMVRQIEGRTFAERRLRLEQQVELVEDQAEDELAVRIWQAQELAKIEKEELEYQRDHAEDFTTFIRRQLQLDTKTYRSEYQERLDRWTYMYDQMGDVVESFASSTKDVVGDALFDTWESRGKGFLNYWDTLWTSMKRTMASAIADMATEWAASQLLQWGSGLVTSFFHSGSSYIKSDEIRAVLQEGEMVIPAKQAEEIRRIVGAGDGVSSADYFSAVSGAVALGSSKGDGLRAAATMSPEALGILGSNMMGGLLAGGAAAINNFQQTVSIGQQLQAQGLALSDERIQAVAMDQAQAGFVSGMFSGVGGFIGEMTAYSLGVQDYNFSGSIANAALAALTGVGLPGVMTAALSGVTALAISAVADAFGLRENEALRDQLESKYGFIQGRQMYQALQSAAKGRGADVGLSDLGLDIASLVESVGVSGALDVALAQASRLAAVHSMAQAATTYGAGWADTVAAVAASLEAQAGLVSGSIGWGIGSTEELAQLLTATKLAVTTTAARQSEAERIASYYAMGGSGPGGGTGGVSVGSSPGWTGGGGLSAQLSGGQSSPDPGGGTGGMGFSKGGIIKQIMIPRGDQGIITARLGESVNSEDHTRKLGKMLDDYVAGVFNGSSGETNLHVTIVTTDGKRLSDFVIRDIKSRSRNGEVVVYADGVGARP